MTIYCSGNQSKFTCQKHLQGWKYCIVYIYKKGACKRGHRRHHAAEAQHYTVDSFKRSLVCWGYIYMYIDACLIVTCTVACTQVFQLFVVVNQNTIHRINHLVFQCFPPITPMACRLRLCVQCTYTISLPLWGFMFYVCLYLIFLKYSIQYIIY